MSESEESYDSASIASAHESSYSYSMETSYEASTSISSPSKFDERLAEIRKLYTGVEYKEAVDYLPYLIYEPKLYDGDALTNLKDVAKLSEEVHIDEFSESFDYDASSPAEEVDVSALPTEEYQRYYKKLAAHYLRERVLLLSEYRKLSRGQKQKLKFAYQKETFQAEFELCQQEVYQYLQQIAEKRGVELEKLQEMLDASDIDYFEVSEGLKEQIAGFYKRLAYSSPINDHFIENIGRLVFKYKEVEKKDFGLTTEDLFALDQKTFERLTLELPEYNGLGDVDIRLYRYLQHDGVIQGSRQYTQQQEDDQRYGLEAARSEVKKKYPWMFKTHANSAQKQSTSYKIAHLRQYRYEKNNRRNDRAGGPGKRGK